MAKKIMEQLDRFAINIGMRNANIYDPEEIESSMSYFEATASEKEIEAIRKFYHQYGEKVSGVDGKNNF